LIAWAANLPDSGDQFVALFNASDDPSISRKVNRSQSSFSELGINGAVRVRDFVGAKRFGGIY